MKVFPLTAKTGWNVFNKRLSIPGKTDTVKIVWMNQPGKKRIHHSFYLDDIRIAYE